MYCITIQEDPVNTCKCSDFVFIYCRIVMTATELKKLRRDRGLSQRGLAELVSTKLGGMPSILSCKTQIAKAEAGDKKGLTEKMKVALQEIAAESGSSTPRAGKLVSMKRVMDMASVFEVMGQVKRCPFDLTEVIERLKSQGEVTPDIFRKALRISALIADQLQAKGLRASAKVFADLVFENLD